MKRFAFIVALGVVMSGVCGRSAYAIKRADMPGYCEGKVLATYAVPVSRIRMREVVKTTDGSYSIDGTVHMGRKGIERFRCAFDVRGQFVGLLEVDGSARN